MGVSIPFEQGDVFRLDPETGAEAKNPSQSLSNRAMFFDEIIMTTLFNANGLNPFRTGRCFSTNRIMADSAEKFGLNPFRTGRCFSTYYNFQQTNEVIKSQSLSNRAMFFD